MKKIFLFFFIIILLFSCKKKQEENKDIFGEVFYTDSFSPSQWENPITREKLAAVDKDIGKYINQEIIDPDLRKILMIVENFILNLQSNNYSAIEKNMTPSCFNSFNLRYTKVNFGKDYSVRVAYPESLMNSTSSESDIDNEEKIIIDRKKLHKKKTDDKKTITLNVLENEPFWIQFKLLFLANSFIGKLQLVMNKGEYKISDFDNQFFNELTNAFSKEKNDVINNR